jgi:uncharacterized repeat protein (TIGR03847 family)
MADLGPVRRIEARATGRPGQREFRLWVIGAHQEFARLKIEKEHLLGLGMAIHRVLSDAAAPAPPPGQPSDDFPAAPGYDFVVGRLGVGFSEADGMIILEVDEVAPEEEKSPFTLRFAFNRSQAAQLAREIDEVIATGRPPCRLCSQPIDPAGHICVKTNGHTQQPIPEQPSEDDEE